jgi:cob(I)alamin adenosyltransferase
MTAKETAMVKGYPTMDEMNALQAAARRARARQLRRMFRAVVRGLKSLAARLSEASAGKRVSHA